MLTPPDPAPHLPDGAAAPVALTPPPPTPAEPGAATPKRRLRLWPIVLTVVLVASVIGAATVPLPYYLYRPGSVRDTEPLIAVDGVEVYASDGTISYTTVSLRQATLFGLASGWIDDDIDIEPRDEVLGGRDADENHTLNLQMMDTSKQVATQVALERLGYQVDVSITGETIVEVIPDMPADGVLDPGDTITAVDGEPIDDPDDLTRLLGDDSPGDEVTITVQTHGAATQRDVELALAPDPDDPRRAIMGVLPSPRGVDFDFPFDIEIDTGDIGGPSAGLAFTLAIIDDLTPGDLTGGAKVAVTGTIAGHGSVGPVGGTGQKAAAVRAGDYDVFLVPSADYEAALGHAGDVDVVAVDTLDEALAALADLGGNADDLPRAGSTDPAG
ncbi:MAG: YlbL family protein [Acidimicrobiales bacterium]